MLRSRSAAARPLLSRFAASIGANRRTSASLQEAWDQPPLDFSITTSRPASLPVSKWPALSFEESRELRKRHLAPALKAHYDESERGPLKLIHGEGQYLYDLHGERYLDCVNNVCHVGHCHPRVVTAASTQLAMLNTNSRYLHDNIARLAERLTATMPSPLEVVFFVNSGSEANDLALRLARNYTGRQDVYCVDGAYHGNSAATLAVSPYSKYGPSELPHGTVKLANPDKYRHGMSDAEMTEACAEEFARELEARPIPPAAYIVESLICCGGQVVLPDGYLKQMHGLVRAHGGLAIADEVQTGFGRIGSHMWAFESQDATPDIVTVGKPFGNGFPLAAVVTTREVAEASARIEYFNTFGGNPVACAVGLEVLQVVGDERLQEHALHTGRATRALLEELALKQPSIGDVRGMGLLLGVELVKDRTTREPDADAASFAMQWMRSYQNVLVSTDGPHRNVIKVKPPMKFTVDDGKTLTAALDAALDAFARAKR